VGGVEFILMADYQCPLCSRTMERNLALFLDHTEAHVIDQIKKEHPEWVTADGICQPCTEYFKKQLSGELKDANIGPAGRRRRLRMGVAMLVLSLGLAVVLSMKGSAPSLRFLLFLPLFVGMLGLIQAREKTCALLAEKGLRDMDAGEGPVEDSGIARRLQRRGRFVIVKSVFSAALVTGLFFLLP